MSGVHTIALDGVLIVTLPAVTDDRTAEQLVEQVAQRLAAQSAQALLVDMSQARLLDSFMARVISALAGTARLLGVAPVVAGIRPEVAMTMVELGLDLGGIATALDIEHGLAVLRARAGGRV